MKLSTIFFILTPFGFFCTGNGTGLITGSIFLILGFVFKWIESNSGSTPTATVKVEPQKFWEWHYKDRMRSMYVQKDSGDEGKMAIHDREARQWATTICGCHNAWVPPEAKQEQIARENGVVTEKMIKERKEKKDRIQIAKYFLMEELENKYSSTKIGKGGRERCCFPKMEIKEDKYRIKTSDYSMVSEYWTKSKYNKSIREMWDSLSEEEKNQATRWVEEYEKKLMEQVNEYVYGDLYPINVEMNF